MASFNPTELLIVFATSLIILLSFLLKKALGVDEPNRTLDIISFGIYVIGWMLVIPHLTNSDKKRSMFIYASIAIIILSILLAVWARDNNVLFVVSSITLIVGWVSLGLAISMHRGEVARTFGLLAGIVLSMYRTSSNILNNIAIPLGMFGFFLLAMSNSMPEKID
jgi:Na+/melibiose symporter-like transporter